MVMKKVISLFSFQRACCLSQKTLIEIFPPVVKQGILALLKRFFACPRGSLYIKSLLLVVKQRESLYPDPLMTLNSLAVWGPLLPSRRSRSLCNTRAQVQSGFFLTGTPSPRDNWNKSLVQPWRDGLITQMSTLKRVPPKRSLWRRD